MKIALNKCDFKIFHVLNYLRWTPPPPKGRPRGGSVTKNISENTALPRRAPEGPWGGESSQNFIFLTIFIIPVWTHQVHARFNRAGKRGIKIPVHAGRAGSIEILYLRFLQDLPQPAYLFLPASAASSGTDINTRGIIPRIPRQKRRGTHTLRRLQWYCNLD